MNDPEHDDVGDSAGDARAAGVDKSERNEGIARAVQAYLLYVALPAWTIPGFSDYLCHRATKIERTSGTHESLTHSLMMASIGVPALMALLFEINASTLIACSAGCAVHEGIVLWDVAYAADRRKVTTTEQHVHSFLEVLPFATLSFLMCLHWDQVLALARKGPSRADFLLRPKQKPVPATYLAAVGALITGLIAIPYAEELIRCFRVDHTFLPHPPEDIETQP